MAVALDLNNNIIFFENLFGVLAEDYANDATLEATVYEDFDKTTGVFSNPVSGAEDLTMTWITDSNGGYYAALDYTIDWTPNRKYYAVIQGVGDWAHFKRSIAFMVRNP